MYSDFDEEVYKSGILEILIKEFEKIENCKVVYTIAEDEEELEFLQRLGFKKVGEKVLKKKLSTQRLQFL